MREIVRVSEQQGHGKKDSEREKSPMEKMNVRNTKKRIDEEKSRNRTRCCLSKVIGKKGSEEEKERTRWRGEMRLEKNVKKKK